MNPQSAQPSPRRKVLVTGATGMLGCSLVPELERGGWDVVRVARTGDVSHSLDLCDSGPTQELIAQVQPSAVVHLAAATDVDLCERDPQLAFRQNVLAADNLAAACALLERRPVVVHLSTDHLYDAPGSNREEDVIVRNHYAMSKLAGEYAALRHGAATVLRVNFVGRSRHPRRRSFSDWVVGSLKDRKPIGIFDDVMFSPLRIDSLVAALIHVLDHPAPGVFNLGARGSVSKAQLALLLGQSLGLDTSLMTAGPIGQRTGLAPRPRGMAMDSGRFERAFSYPLPTIDDEAKALVQEYLNEL